MSKKKSIMSLIGSLFAALYFISAMLLAIFIIVFTILSFPSNVSTVRESGFAGPNTDIGIVGACGLIIGLSMLIPPLRKMYYALPWLNSFIKIFFINYVILNIGMLILNYGYQVNNEARHKNFFILMLIQIVVCRIGMCIYFKLRPVKHLE